MNATYLYKGFGRELLWSWVKRGFRPMHCLAHHLGYQITHALDKAEYSAKRIVFNTGHGKWRKG